MVRSSPFALISKLGFVLRRRRLAAGFTLIELMVVVTIIGVLAVLAVTTYQRFTKRARTAEAKSNLGAIKTKEEAYFQEFAQYCNVSEPHPATVPPANKVDWAPAAGSNWRVLGWNASGPVLYQYDVVAGAAGDPGLPAGKGLDGTRPWFLASARGDLDADSTTSLYEITNNRTAIYSTDDLE